MDQYTRSGKAVLRAFVQQSAVWQSFSDRWSISRRDRAAAAGEILFRVDGAVLTNRAETTEGAVLRERSTSLGCFMAPEAVAEATRILQLQLPYIEEMRSALPLP